MPPPSAFQICLLVRPPALGTSHTQAAVLPKPQHLTDSDFTAGRAQEEKSMEAGTCNLHWWAFRDVIPLSPWTLKVCPDLCLCRTHLFSLNGLLHWSSRLPQRESNQHSSSMSQPGYILSSEHAVKSIERELFGKVLHLTFNALSLICIKKMRCLLLCKRLPECSHLSKYSSISIKMLQALAKSFFLLTFMIV